MILRLLLGAGIGGGVSWYLDKRDQQSLMRSAGIGAGAMFAVLPSWIGKFAGARLTRLPGIPIWFSNGR